jgi:hypothetical protein
MAKAKRVYSTPPTNTPISQNSIADPTRRHLLTVAAGGAVAALALPTAKASEADPIFAVIERHGKACREHNEAIDTHMDFEEVGMTGEKLEKYNSLVADTAAAYDELEDAGLDQHPADGAGRYFCALPVHQTAIRRGRRAGPAGIYFVPRRQNSVPGRSIRLCDRPSG